jgi:hypothetical protein
VTVVIGRIEAEGFSPAHSAAARALGACLGIGKRAAR